MKRNTLRFVASMLLFGYLLLVSFTQSFADDKKDVENVKFSCSFHGPANMVLTLSLEKGKEGEKPRKIDITGKGGGKWIVAIDGVPAKAGEGGNSGDTVKVRPKDTITWSVADNSHGVAFADQDLAKAMLTFGKSDVKLEDLTDFLKTQDWKDFGTKRWGNKFTDKKVVLASATVNG